MVKIEGEVGLSLDLNSGSQFCSFQLNVCQCIIAFLPNKFHKKKPENAT